MGWSLSYFRWAGQEWVRVPARCIYRFVEGSVRVESGGDALETASVTLELEDRVPVRIAPPRFDRWPLVAEGSLDINQVRHGVALVMDSVLGPALAAEGESSVVHAESRFEHRRHQIESRWEPTAKQLALLVPALKKAGVSATLAHRIVERR